jgi:hypothetical protein
MVTAQDLFNQLARGPLSNLAIASTGSIDPGSYSRVFDALEEGLLDIYTRFVLKEDDTLVLMHGHRTFYWLLPQYSVNYVPADQSDDEEDRFILDLPAEPFKDELVRVLTVFDSFGCQIPLNDETAWNSVFTPQAKLLQVPRPVDGMALNVRYQRRHPPLNDELSANIECPDVLLPALKAYVAYKVFDDMNSAESVAKGQRHQENFETICQKVVDRDLVGTSTSQSNTRFERGGWR